jgi:hypothetical protein
MRPLFICQLSLYHFLEIMQAEAGAAAWIFPK